ncbi:MAG: CRISPR system precrRNA processing endoribonuclease RAMP protein Cas6 [Verrucomicrobia bacterium]|nr:CRISPR system precrRNA processing endoribonuclease RAMP protein Cas6 [Deltaproteobacteria bacterium]
MGFNLVNLAITVRADDVSRLRFCLPLLGKEYAAACRSLSCHRPERTCETCSAQESCGWYLVFGQKLTPDPAALKRHQKPPLPFVFSFPMLEGYSDAHKEIECGLVVIGQAIPHLGMLLDGFTELLSGGLSPFPAEVIQIACRDYQGFVQHVSGDHGFARSGNLAPENLLIASTEGLLESRTWGGSDLHIRLLSPLRLLKNGHLVGRFEFSLFARSVMRRVSSLAYYYGESEFDCDFKELSRQVDDVVCTDDHFCYANVKNRKLTGLSGYGSFLGDFSRLMPFLVIGSYLHTGKGSSFGMGAYELLPDDGSRAM